MHGIKIRGLVVRGQSKNSPKKSPDNRSPGSDSVHVWRMRHESETWCWNLRKKLHVCCSALHVVDMESAEDT